tara:strand:+ start:760 stop:966 length:207 start_codon:yes stop_codon:yes gene_type:complete
VENDTIRKISFWCRSSFVVSIIGIFCVVRESVVNFVVFGKVVVFYEYKRNGWLYVFCKAFVGDFQVMT